MPTQTLRLPRDWTSIASNWPDARTVRLVFQPGGMWVEATLQPGETLRFQRGTSDVYLEVDVPAPIEITAIRQGGGAAGGDKN